MRIVAPDSPLNQNSNQKCNYLIKCEIKQTNTNGIYIRATRYTVTLLTKIKLIFFKVLLVTVDILMIIPNLGKCKENFLHITIKTKKKRHENKARNIFKTKTHTNGAIA